MKTTASMIRGFAVLARLRQMLPIAFLLTIFLTGASTLAQPATDNRTTLLVVVGAAGEEEYGKNFAAWAELWRTAAVRGHARETVLGLGTPAGGTDHDRLQKLLADEPKESNNELWIVLIGHGTFDGKEAKFNLHGPDITATELAEWLKPFHRPMAVVNCASASGPFLSKLSAPGRVIVTANRSGYEVNYARFGQYLAEAIGNPEADLDKDGQTSLLEAFIFASNRTAEFYKNEGRLATEHALIDDNGDGLGTPADWFRGVRAVKRAKEGAAVDGLRAHQFHLVRSEFEEKLPPATRARRNELEVSIAKLRDRKSEMDEDAYYKDLEKLLLQVARLYQTETNGAEAPAKTGPPEKSF